MTFVEPHMRESLKHHCLKLHVDAPLMRAYYLRSPREGRMMSTYIIFSVEGIVILGDLCPKQNGVISCLGYGEAWFGNRLSEHYLCEKFLQKEWVPEKGYGELMEDILRARRSDSIEKDQARNAYTDLNEIDKSELTAETAYRIFHEAGMSDFEIGYGYKPRDAGWLCAIQQRFSRLWRAQELERDMGTFAYRAQVGRQQQSAATSVA